MSITQHAPYMHAVKTTLNDKVIIVYTWIHIELYFLKNAKHLFVTLKAYISLFKKLLYLGYNLKIHIVQWRLVLAYILILTSNPYITEKVEYYLERIDNDKLKSEQGVNS